MGGQRWIWGARVCDPPAYDVGLSFHNEKTLSWVGPRLLQQFLPQARAEAPTRCAEDRSVGQRLENRREGQLTRLCAEAGTWTAVLTQLTWVTYWPLGNKGSPGHLGEGWGPGCQGVLILRRESGVTWQASQGLPGRLGSPDC